MLLGVLNCEKVNMYLPIKLPKEGIYDNRHFLDVSNFSQIKGAPGTHFFLHLLVLSGLPFKIIFMLKWTILGLAYSDLHEIFYLSVAENER